MSIYTSAGTSAAGKRLLQLASPVTLEPTGTLECADRADVDAAVAHARAAQPGWSALGFKARAEHMQRMLEVVLDHKDEIVERVISETGKAPGDALSMEVFAACDALHYYSHCAEKILAPTSPSIHGILGFAKKLKILYKPRGVVGIIVPWNGPFILGLNPAVQALMAGNTAVIKGSEVTPHSTALVAELFLKAGLPEAVCQVLMGDGQTGADLCEADIDKISFTGSVATGRRVAEVCGRRLIPCTLELGGNDAMIVCADADIDKAADGALMGACMNTGHYCCGTERIYVVADAYDSFVAEVQQRAAALNQGQAHGLDEDVGAVFWDRQMDIIEEHVQAAVADGAKVLLGGRRNPDEPGLYYLPTVIVDVHRDMKIMQRETFGPILCIQRVADEAEAIALANDSCYGLNGSVWTRDRRKGLALAALMETGSASVNDMAVSYGVHEAPFGGVKDSGLGQVNGEVGLKNYCHAMPIVIDRFPMANSYPHSDKKYTGMKKFIDFLWRNPIGRWLAR